MKGDKTFCCMCCLEQCSFWYVMKLAGSSGGTFFTCKQSELFSLRWELRLGALFGWTPYCLRRLHLQENYKNEKVWKRSLKASHSFSKTVPKQGLRPVKRILEPSRDSKAAHEDFFEILDEDSSRVGLPKTNKQATKSQKSQPTSVPHGLRL